ncbi:MAG: hypothetical protein JW793_03595 [Acidobacteria bacterium]|nr:hypothetical protein [Acidobacteriota bacterium]
MISDKAVLQFPIFLLTAMLLQAGCANPSAENTGINPSGPVDGDEIEVDWGREVGLDEMIAMAKDGRIREIQWHVMPNILRAVAPDGSIFHLRNENKGVDLRNTLLEAGVRIGEDGVRFRHFF